MFSKTNYCLIQVKSIQVFKKILFSTFIKLPFVIKKTFVLFSFLFFEWSFYAGFTVSSTPVFNITRTVLIVVNM